MLRTHHSVREYILEGIESGRFPPGFRLPTERALCDTLSVHANLQFETHSPFSKAKG
jgi:DNA-binding FadR family transcriptional regulator